MVNTPGFASRYLATLQLQNKVHLFSIILTWFQNKYCKEQKVTNDHKKMA